MRRANFFSLAAAALSTLLAACAGMGTAMRTAPSPAGPHSDRPEVRAAANEKLITPADSGALTLTEAVDQLSRALLQVPAGTAWKPAASRAREIQRNRPEIAKLMEDADWVVTLSGELEGPRPAAQKAGLRRLHESYVAGVPHAEIVAQVNALLADIQDEQLRRELKKLANRSWERERRTPENPAKDTSLTPDAYCAQRRVEAANAFADARAATDPDAKKRRLQTSLRLLDACIQAYPDSPEAEKARQNRQRVEQELRP